MPAFICVARHLTRFRADAMLFFVIVAFNIAELSICDRCKGQFVFVFAVPTVSFGIDSNMPGRSIPQNAITIALMRTDISGDSPVLKLWASDTKVVSL